MKLLFVLITIITMGLFAVIHLLFNNTQEIYPNIIAEAENLNLIQYEQR